VLDPIGVQVLQLDPIVVQQPLQESMGRGHDFTLMERHEGHDVPIGGADASSWPGMSHTIASVL
jgi:hypothetical protein